jgi:photosystem II stability/assembly factor-like uncharacterized protein
MIPDDLELRRALNARSADMAPAFRDRIHGAIGRGRPSTNWTPAVAAVVVIALSVASVGVLLAARNFGSHGGLVSGARTATPSPTPLESPVVLPSEAYLSAPSRDVVWAFVDYRLLFRSRDRGQTWERRQLPSGEPAGPAPTFSFTSADHGWALVPGEPATQCQAAGAQIWHTSDGAMTWHLITSVDVDHNALNSIGAAQCKEFISFVDERTGFVTAWDDNSPPTIYRTIDGGSTWKKSRLPDPPGFKSEGGGFTLRAHEVYRFGSTVLLTAYGIQESGGRGYAYKSVDGGATWTYVATLPNPAISVAFVTESRWLQVIIPGQSVETTDAGRSWHAFASDYGQAAPVSPQVVFGDASVGYATVRGSIQRTEDGGLHWTYIKTPGVVQPG